ncbi:MAG: CHAT domain-containing protein [Aureispira sp.]
MMRFPSATSKPDAPLPQCLRKASMLFESAPTIEDAPMLREHARQLLELGQRDYAKDIFERLVVLNREAYDKKDERYVRALVDLASAYVLLIRYQEAAGLFEEAIPSAKAIKGANSLFYLEVLNDAGFCHSRLQNWGKGFRFFSDALKIIEERMMQKSDQHIVLLNNLAACYQHLNQADKAIRYYQEALSLAKNKPRLGLNIAPNLAEVYIHTGATTKALPLIARYEPLLAKHCLSPSMGTARIWTQYAQVHMKMENFDAAEHCLQKGFVANSLVFTTVNDLPEQAEALMHNNQFLAVCAQAGLMMTSIELYKTRYEKTQELVHLEKGYKIVQSMTRFGEKLMGSYLSEANKLILFRLGAAILFDRSLYYAFHLHQQTNDQKYVEDAFFYSERSKSTLLTHALRSKDQQNLLELPIDIVTTNKAYVKQFKHLQKSKIEAPTLALRDKVQQEINELNVKIERFKDEVKKKYPDYYEHRYEQALTNLSAIQTFLSKGDKAMLEYAIGVQYNYAFLVTKSSINMMELKFDPKEFAAQTQELRTALTDYDFVVKQKEQSQPAYEVAAHYFYKTFTKELVELTAVNQPLIIVPDQQLGHLPFETFLTEEPAANTALAALPYLLKRNPISYSYSATILLNQVNRKTKRVVPEKGVLAFAASYPAVEPNSFSHQRGGDLGILREGLAPLPGAKQEVELMQEHLWGAFFNGNTASEKNFKSEASKYNIIHLAMHGILNPSYPILSSLVFTEDSSEVEDNFLRAYEIAQMDLNADLVVLSACETGYGKFQQGEGVMSLAHSFAYAGASSVLMSLWQVNDLSTTAIMKAYYTNLAQFDSKEQALQKAKLDYMEAQDGSILSHPAFWAAFVQTGDTAPMELVTKTGKTFRQMHYLLTGGVLLLVFGVGFVFYRRSKNRKAA